MYRNHTDRCQALVVYKSPEEIALKKKLNFPFWIDDVLKPEQSFRNQDILDEVEARKSGAMAGAASQLPSFIEKEVVN